MKTLKSLILIFAMVGMSSCLTTAILTTVMVNDKSQETVTARANGDAIKVNVKCALSVQVTCNESWISFSETKFTPGLNDGKELIIYVEPTTTSDESKAVIYVVCDDEHKAEITLTRAGKNDKRVTDIDGNVYRVEKMGSYYWTRENLMSTQYDSESEAYGRTIEKKSIGEEFVDRNYVDPSENSNLGAMKNYKHRMGLLYNWCAAMGMSVEEAASDDVYGISNSAKYQGICPNGFHIPNYDEIVDLQKAMGGADKGGTALKSKNGWNYDSGDGTSIFDAYPVGRYDKSSHLNLCDVTYFWASKSLKGGNTYGNTLKYCFTVCDRNYMKGERTDKFVIDGGYYVKDGFSVRCVKN